jgi:hypothetical protein
MFWPTLQLPFSGCMNLDVIVGTEDYIQLAMEGDGYQYGCALN